MCSDDVDCDDFDDPRTEAGRARHGVALERLGCAWGDALIGGREPDSWAVVRRLLADGRAGMLVPSFASGAAAEGPAIRPRR